MTVALLSLFGTLVAALGAYFAIARKLSGKIATSEAGQLWAESSAMRQQFADENKLLRARIDALEERADLLGTDNRALRIKNTELEDRIDACELENTELKRLNATLQARLDTIENGG